MIEVDDRETISWVADPKTYLHYVKDRCVTCEAFINPEDYIQNGNFCLRCCGRATAAAHRRIHEKREMDELRGLVDNLFARR